MRKRDIFWVQIIFLVSGANTCQAQRRIALQEAVDQALRLRASLKAEQERISVAQGLSQQAGLRPNPEFQFQEENLRPGQDYSRDVDTLALINQPLDVLGKQKERMATANQATIRTQAEYDLARRQLTGQVKLAYWAARGAQEIHDTVVTTVENFREIEAYHSAQLSAGAIPEQDYLRVRLEGERLRISADLANIDAARARAALFREMGETNFTDAVLTDSLAPESEEIPTGPDQALARRIEIRVARAALEQARSNARLQDVSARPDLSISYGYKRTQLPNALAGVNTAVVALRVTLPVANRNQGNRVAAEAEVLREEQLLNAAETEVRADYNTALQEYKLQQSEFVNSLQPLRDDAADISRIAAAAYAAGGTDLLRLLDAERVRLDAQLAWVRGMVEYRQSIVRLEAAEGLGQ